VDQLAAHSQLFGDVALHPHVVRDLAPLVGQRHNRAGGLEHRTVLAPVHERAGPAFAFRHFGDLVHVRQRFFGQQRGRRLVEQLSQRVAHGVAERSVRVPHATVAGDDENQLVGFLNRRAHQSQLPVHGSQLGAFHRQPRHEQRQDGHDGDRRG
jgi:hypothetical protein